MNRFKCKKCGKLSTRTGRYKGYICYQCFKHGPPKPIEKREIIKFDRFEYPPVPDHFKIDKGCRYSNCNDAMFIKINDNIAPRDISNVSKTSWLNSLVKKTPNENTQKNISYIHFYISCLRFGYYR